MIGRLRQLSEPRLRQQAGIEKSQTPVRKGYSCQMGEKPVSTATAGVTKSVLCPDQTGGYAKFSNALILNSLTT